MSGEGSEGNREVPLVSRPLEEGGPWGKHGFPHGSEPEASDAHSCGSFPCQASSARPQRPTKIPAPTYWWTTSMVKARLMQSARTIGHGDSWGISTTSA